ncbi:MAG: ribbon-helix-helix domain-containing protein [Actinomycetota bacterium]
MSKQIAVRLPDDLVEFVDGLVKSGEASSRAAVVARALEQARRRERAAADAEILAKAAADADLDSLAGFVAGLPNDDLE